MQKQAMGQNKKQQYNTSLIILAILILIAGVVIFIGLELQRNEKLFIRNYNNEQQQLVDQVAIRMQHSLVNDAMTQDEAIDQMLTEVLTTGNRYWFIARNDVLVFAKNKNTVSQMTEVTLSSFLQDMKLNEVQVSYREVQIDRDIYTLGSCTTLDYIMEEGDLLKHVIFIIMPLAVLSLVTTAVVIRQRLSINKQQDMIDTLREESIERNITIDELTNRLKKTTLHEEHSGNQETVIYNKEVLASLLEKINRENIVPLIIVIIELTSKNGEYGKEEYQNLIKATSEFLLEDHVFAEVIPGVYAILMFHMVCETKEEIKQTLIHNWALPLKEKGIKVRMGLTCIDDYDANVENIFELVYQEVANMKNNSYFLT